MCRVLNKHHAGVPAGAVYIGRGSKWGNLIPLPELIESRRFR